MPSDDLETRPAFVPEPLHEIHVARKKLRVDPGGSLLDVEVSCPLGCVFTLTPGVAWLRVVRIEASGNGRARARLLVEPNETGAPRAAAFKLLETLVSVSQREGEACSPVAPPKGGGEANAVTPS